MTELPTVPHNALREADQAVQLAYDAARASAFAPELKRPLWEAGVQAVSAYAELAPDAPKARNYHHLVVDLAPEDETWPEPVRLAVRIAAEKTIATPGKPHHRARAKGLLRRIEAMNNPLLAARERALVAIARQLQALSRQALEGAGPEERLYRLQAHQQWLSRFSEAVRALPLDATDQSLLAELFNRVLTLAEAAVPGDPAHEGAMFELLQHLRVAGAPALPLAPVMDALTAVRHASGSLHRAARLELLAMVLDVDATDLAPEQQAGLAVHLDSVAHLARQLGEVPAEALPGLLLRLRLRLQAHGEDAFEPLIDEAVRLIDRLEARRLEAGALLQAVEAEEDWDPDEIRQERLRYQQQAREAGWMLDAVRGLKLARTPRALAPRMLHLLREIDALAAGHALDPEDLQHTLGLIARQLENPQLLTSRAWLAGQNTIMQLAAQRRAVADEMRAQAVERHLEPDARRAEQQRLQRQLEDLERARHSLASLPLDRVPAEREAEVLGALQAITLGIRRMTATGDRDAWREAFQIAATICA